MADVELEDYRVQVKRAMSGKTSVFLTEAAALVESRAKSNSRVDTGQLKGSWSSIIDTAAQEAQIGSPLENAIWEEYGTGEYAVNGDGRKGGWFYEDDKGNGHFTRGKTPNRTLQKAFEAAKNAIIRRAKELFRELGA